MVQNIYGSVNNNDLIIQVATWHGGGLRDYSSQSYNQGTSPAVYWAGGSGLFSITRSWKSKGYYGEDWVDPWSNSRAGMLVARGSCCCIE